MPSLLLAIVADDLTGALDAAAPFSAAPGGAVVATGPAALARALALGAAVVAVSTRSREVAPDKAQATVAEVLAALPVGIRLFKKIDSRLKGNVAAELAAFGGRPLLVAPAIPEFGRIVRDGRLSGFGVDGPLDVRPMLGEGAGRAEIPDTATVEEMARALAGAPVGALPVGARGLAQALAAAMGLVPAPAPARLEAPACLAVGSTDPITLAQVAALRAARPGLTWVAAPSGRVPRPEGAPEPLTLVQATPGPAEAPAEVAAAFATGAAEWLRPMRSMLLTGGATAEAVLDALGIDVLTIAGEALPGLPLSRAGGQEIVTKSGGFGAPDTLVRVVPE